MAKNNNTDQVQKFEGISLPDTYNTTKKKGLLTSRQIQVCFDVLLFVTVCGILTLLILRGPPRHIGFFCDDVTLLYPYQGDTIPRFYIYISIGAFVLFCVLVIEFITQVLHSRHLHGRSIQFLLSVLKLLMLFLYGNMVTMVITETMRLVSGRLRPHFIDTCRPNVALHNCTNKYITQYECRNPDTDAVLDARKSFPSLEAAFSVYNTIVILIYIEEKRVLRFSAFLKSIVQTILLLYCACINIIQVNDNRSHPSDVIMAVLIGSGMAIWSVFCLTNHVRKQSVMTSSTSGVQDVLTDEMFEPIKNIHEPKRKSTAGTKQVLIYGGRPSTG